MLRKITLSGILYFFLLLCVYVKCLYRNSVIVMSSQQDVKQKINLRDLQLDLSSTENAKNAITEIDKYLKQINEKQTEYGAAYNRLESALESIGVSIDNLTSTQSTIKDADITEESSEYIKMQILQQASATLLATANQTPSIALQLL